MSYSLTKNSLWLANTKVSVTKFNKWVKSSLLQTTFCYFGCQLLYALVIPLRSIVLSRPLCPPQKKNRRRGAFHCFCSPPGGGKTPGWNTNPLHWPATTAISINNALFSVPLFHFSATDNSRLLMMRDNPSDIIPTRLWRRSRRPFRLNTQAWCDRQTDRQRRLDGIALCICEVGRVILYYAIMKHAVGLYIGCSDVTESMVTIWSPFCGYNTV